jgi:transposase
MSAARKPYPSDVSDDEWALVAPYLTLTRDDAPQREYPLRDVLDALRWVAEAGGQWRYLPHDFPPRTAVYPQARRGVAAGAFEATAPDLREVIRLAAGRSPSPSAVVPDGRTTQPTPESGGRAGEDGHKRRNGSKVRAAVGTRGLLLALTATAAGDQEGAQVADSCEAVQRGTGQTASLAYVDQGYTGDQPAADAAAHRIALAVVAHTEAKKGFALLPRRWGGERSFGWRARFRRLARDYERTAEVLAGWQWVAFAGSMPHRIAPLPAQSA